MTFRDLLGETLRTLRAHTLRTALTMFGIAWGIVSITLMVAAREGLRAGQQKVAEGFGKDIMLETVIVVFLSGGIGLAAAYAVCGLVNRLPMPQFFTGLIPTWESGALAMALLGTVAVLSALYPASRAAAVDPTEALRFEAGG